MIHVYQTMWPFDALLLPWSQLKAFFSAAETGGQGEGYPTLVASMEPQLLSCGNSLMQTACYPTHILRCSECGAK